MLSGLSGEPDWQHPLDAQHWGLRECLQGKNFRSWNQKTNKCKIISDRRSPGVPGSHGSSCPASGCATSTLSAPSPPPWRALLLPTYRSVRIVRLPHRGTLVCKTFCPNTGILCMYPKIQFLPWNFLPSQERICQDLKRSKGRLDGADISLEGLVVLSSFVAWTESLRSPSCLCFPTLNEMRCRS